MTFDAQQSANIGAALGLLRDTVSGDAAWTLIDDSAGGGDLTRGDYFVLESSSPAEQIKLEFESEFGGIQIQHGTDWDSTNTEWTSRYEYDPTATGMGYDGNDGSYTNGFQALGVTEDTDFPLEPTASGSYWLLTLDRGFGFYWQREEGDGRDEDIFIGMAKVDKAWDYSLAETKEAEWSLAFGDSARGYQELTYMSLSGDTDGQGNKTHRPGNNTYVARGQVNPDNAYDNFPMTNNIISSSRYRTTEGEDTVIGTHDLWVDDRSASSTGHRDLIKNDSGTNVYTILTRQGTPNVALRMIQ